MVDGNIESCVSKVARENIQADMITSLGKSSKLYRLTLGSFLVILLFYLVCCVVPVYKIGVPLIERVAMAGNYMLLIVIAYLYLTRLTTKYKINEKKSLKVCTISFLLYSIACILYASKISFMLYIQFFVPAIITIAFFILYVEQKFPAKVLIVLSMIWVIATSITFLIAFTNLKIFLIAIACSMSWVLCIYFLPNKLNQESPLEILNLADNKNIDTYISNISKKTLQTYPILASDPRICIIAAGAVSSILRIIYTDKLILWESPAYIYGLYWYASVIFSIEGILLFYDRYYDLILKK